MNKKEAVKILNSEIMRYRLLDHGKLADMIKSPHNYEKIGPSGAVYYLEVQAFWDSPRKPGKDIRLIGSIDDGRFPYGFVPITTGFIKDPEGNFIGEDE